MNSPVSIFTFLAVILIQHTQNAEAAKSVLRENALHLKIDELLLATEAARNELRGIEKLPESELQQVLEDDSPSDAPPS